MPEIHFVVRYNTETNKFDIDDETLMAWKGTNSWFDPKTEAWVKPDEVMENGEDLDWETHVLLGNVLGLYNGNTQYGSLTYFADDGNYGDACDMRIVDTSAWDEEDWARLDGESDWDRPKTALEITEEKNNATI